MSNPTAVSLADHDALLQAVGQAITDWAHVEEGLFQVFFYGLCAPAFGPPGCAFIAADNVRAKIAMVDSIIRHSSLTKLMIPRWNILQKRCDRLRKSRNDLVHRKVTMIKIGQAKPHPALVTYNYDIRHVLKDGRADKVSKIEIARIRELSNEFRLLGDDLDQFARDIPRPKATP